jgi:hypothetical protein
MEELKKSEVKRILVGEGALKNLLDPNLNPILKDSGENFFANDMGDSDWDRLSQLVLPDYPYSILAPWKQFRQIFCNYVNYPENICLGKDKCTKLKGFNIDAGDLLSLIHPMRYPPIPISTPTESEVKRIISLFGIRDGKLTMVYARVNNNNDILQDWAIEYVDPCPDKCPNQLKCPEGIDAFCAEQPE